MPRDAASGVEPKTPCTMSSWQLDMNPLDCHETANQAWKELDLTEKILFEYSLIDLRLKPVLAGSISVCL